VLLFQVFTNREPCKPSADGKTPSELYFTQRKLTIRVIHSNGTVASITEVEIIPRFQNEVITLIKK